MRLENVNVCAPFFSHPHSIRLPSPRHLPTNCIFEADTHTFTITLNEPKTIEQQQLKQKQRQRMAFTVTGQTQFELQFLHGERATDSPKTINLFFMRSTSIYHRLNRLIIGFSTSTYTTKTIRSHYIIGYDV